MALTILTAACGKGAGEEQPQNTAPATPSPTSAPRDSQAAEAALQLFVAAVREGRLDDAWSLYAASVPGVPANHRAERGCDYSIFSYEFPRIQYLFQKTAPFTVLETFGSALGVDVVELRVRGKNDTDYLVTLARAEPFREDYQVMFLNSGRPGLVPGGPDPLPSPEYPQGFCGIWTGVR